jgi:MFS family permease
MAVGIVRMQSIYSWDKEVQGLILSAFFLGYAVLQIPAGYIAVRFGGVRCISASVLGASLLSLLVPMVSARAICRCV